MHEDFEPEKEFAYSLDAEDPLADLRSKFYLPEDTLYMDGNSLGPLSKPAKESIERVISEWEQLGIEGWTDADPPWFWYGEYLGEKLAPLIGANPDEVVVGNSTTVNIHTLIGTFLDAIDGNTILVNNLDFPT
ncbi:MAG: kynureninase, partial [Halobacteriaceae archaeon]